MRQNGGVFDAVGGQTLDPVDVDRILPPVPRRGPLVTHGRSHAE